ncbi:GNAT family N-acetyltransferase [Aeromicrobium ginsengisoli]|uniref:GNAT family N-acetyltransferase n=1 Tax=Aeromicrobium ginsengisoli TaxID=363867 RepID=A0A5M4FDF2_9ACTN|nr:N-acetyltransferase [Aeromicrobium ginsengisoli]KAA1397375.1 GNAT family N-acetyltransferase [Aeromicrobium ginsengisoli]
MIRAAALADVDAIVVIESDCFGTDAWSATLVAAAVEGERSTVLIDDLDAYGVIAVAGDVADLERIAVMPSRRRQGVAGRVLDALCVAARAQDADRMLLEVAADNDAAIAFYDAYGFTTISRRTGYYRGGVDALVMQLELQEDR